MAGSSTKGLRSHPVGNQSLFEDDTASVTGEGAEVRDERVREACRPCCELILIRDFAVSCALLFLLHSLTNPLLTLCCVLLCTLNRMLCTV